MRLDTLTEHEYIYAQALTNLRVIEHLLRDMLPVGPFTEPARNALICSVSDMVQQMYEELSLDTRTSWFSRVDSHTGIVSHIEGDCNAVELQRHFESECTTACPISG